MSYVTDQKSKESLLNFASILKTLKYIDNYTIGITNNNRYKLEFTFLNKSIIVVYIPGKANKKHFQVYVDNEDIGRFNNWDEFRIYMEDNYTQTKTS